MFETLTPHGVVAAALLAPPGADVIAALENVDRMALRDSARVDLLVAWERQSSWVVARSQVLLAAVGDAAETAAHRSLESDDPDELALRSAHAEIGAALRLDDTSAGNRLATARTLACVLPNVHAVLEAGEISLRHAQAIIDATSSLEPFKARAVAEKVLSRARHQTVGQMRRCLRRAVLAADPEAATHRVRKAHAERSLNWWPLEDGMAELRLIASATDVMAVYNAAHSLAKKAKAAGPKRGREGWLPMDALRSDALVHLAAGGGELPQPVAVNVTIDLPTLLGLQDNPAELAGYGPLPAPLARRLAADGRWRRLVCDPLTGALLDLGRNSYRPSDQLARFVKTRDRTCVFPTCNRAAQQCETDHDRPFRPHDPGGGRTERTNLHSRCVNHHTLKHKPGWIPRVDPATGKTSWTSPLNRQYTVEPVDHRATVAADDCPF